MRYDVRKPPDPEEWLALDEQERINVVIAYDRRHLPRLKALSPTITSAV